MQLVLINYQEFYSATITNYIIIIFVGRCLFLLVKCVVTFKAGQNVWLVNGCSTVHYAVWNCWKSSWFKTFVMLPHLFINWADFCPLIHLLCQIGPNQLLKLIGTWKLATRLPPKLSCFMQPGSESIARELESFITIAEYVVYRIHAWWHQTFAPFKTSRFVKSLLKRVNDFNVMICL